ncbi:ATP-binding protein [Nannocystis sp. SCPEA4]|uniref:sensor histidine kinase n=1 Tax=Nannocystis sp. SCPEA4 TaxID=2996787 RepID=UPI0022710DBA|nr:ATP-binding protein [Nannocystis sp. SCPEA4]MCY1054645.1 ATP-binding protein [Nannocystis sp. SCPEA4]
MTRRPFASAERSRVRISGLVLLLGAVLSVATVALVGIRFEDAESELAMEREQRRLGNLAALLSVELAGELANIARDPPAMADPPAAESGAWTTRVTAGDGRELDVRVQIGDLFHAADHLDSTDERVFVLPPGATKFFDLHGLSAGPGVLAELVACGEDTGMLSDEQALQLGLPEYPAFVSVASADGGVLGTWRVAVVGSTHEEVERDRRGMLRVIIKVLLTGITTAAFGYFAFREFRAQVMARHQLELAEQRRAGEEVLARENRTATMLTLASGVAHEVGTPLGLIRVKAEALLDALQDSPEEEDVRTILGQVDRLRDVVQGFLRAARGRMPEQAPSAPAALVQSVCDLIAHRFQAAEVELQVEIAPDMPEVRVNALLVEHALVNLLVNACDASPKGACVTLRVRQEGEDVVFEVLDEGEGVREEDRERLIKPFFSRKAHGTGLGLALTNEIARMSRGSVTLAARSPRGAIATLRLPREVP